MLSLSFGRFAYLTLLFAAAACTNAEPLRPPDDPGLPPSDDLPLLPGGNHAGVIVGFSSVIPIATATAVDARWREARAAGMRIGRVQVDWKDVEPTPNHYELNDLDDRLAVLSKAGLRPFLLIDSIDGEIPDDLRKQLDAHELGWDDPIVLERHAEMIRRIMPIVQRHGVWILAVANEVGNELDRLPPAERQESTRQKVAFAKAAHDEAKRLEPGLAVVVTVREQQFDVGDTEAAFIEVSDVASFNFYCSRFAQNLEVQGNRDTIRGYIDGMFARAGGKSVVLQELGCHAGFEDKPSVTRANPDLQARFFDVVLGELAVRPKLRAAVAFQLLDWDAALVEDQFSRAFREDGVPDSFIHQFAESLESVGLLRLRDGSPRPAWSTFISHLQSQGAP